MTIENVHAESLLRNLTGAGMSLLLVDAADLTQWANRRDAQSRLPELLRRLILTTSDDVEHIAFRADDGVQLGGWDGTLLTRISNNFVPEGYSGWEAGCDSDVKGKADEDYEKRAQNPLGLDPQQTTFVFVTPRRWKNKEKWTAEKRKSKVWKNVIAYDADDIATWLALAPAIHVWLSITLGKHPRDAEDLLTFSQIWSNVTRPAVSNELLITGRRAEVERVHQWIMGEPGALAVQADTQDEAISFVAAAIQQLPNAEHEQHLMRSIVVHDEPTWRTLSATKRPMVLISAFKDRPPHVNLWVIQGGSGSFPRRWNRAISAWT